MSDPDPLRSRRATRHAGQHLAALAEASSDAVLLLDADDRVEAVNARFTLLTGIPAEAAEGQGLDEVLATVRVPADRPDEPGTHDADLLHVRHLQDASRRVLRRTRVDHPPRRGRPTGAVVTLRDVTPQRELAQLEADFVARVSHELRTPLTPIAGFARMLLAKGPSVEPEAHDLALGRIVERADHLARLVDDLLRVAEVQSSDATAPALRPVPLRRTLTEVLRAVGDDHAGRDVRTALHDDTAAALVLGDGDAIREVLTHVLDNALRYSLDGTPVDVHVRRTDPTTLSVAVSDRGPGIPSDQRERVFDAFHRLDDPLHMTTSGVGVGLFLARHLARSMGGDVVHRTHPGRGATFVVNLLTGGSLPTLAPGINTPARVRENPSQPGTRTLGKPSE